MTKSKEGRKGRAALFLDRDGVINDDVGYAYLPEEIRFLPGIFEVARAANALGMPVIVVTNQAGIARGFYEEKDFHALMDWMQKQFRESGAYIDAVYFCPHHPTHGNGYYKVMCACRKPKPGLLLQAAQEHGIDLAASVMVGDSVHDMEAGAAAGVGNLLFLESKKSVESVSLPPITRRMRNLAEILDFVSSTYRATKIESF